MTSLWRPWSDVIFSVSAIVLPSFIAISPKSASITNCHRWVPKTFTEFVSSSICIFDQHPGIFFSFFFFAFLVKALLTQKPFLPVVLEESHCNEKQRSSINTTTCSAGTISYLLLNDLIGSGLVGEKRRGKTSELVLVWWSKLFPSENILNTVVFVCVLMGLNITGFTISFQCRNPTESFWKRTLLFSLFPYPSTAHSVIY